MKMTARNTSRALKNTLRQQIKILLKEITPASRESQSKAVTEKVLEADVFHRAKNVSIYLSTLEEIDTTHILCELFRFGKNVFVPTYKGNAMKMLLLSDWNDFETLPLSKWQIKQPNFLENRRDGMEEGIDLFLLPGVAFTMSGGRLGHGMGYYDKYLNENSKKFPQKKSTLIGLAFKEQIVSEDALHMEQNDVRLDYVFTI